MRVFVCFLIGISLSLGDKLDRTYLPPPGSKFSGGSDGDLLGPLDYSRPQDRLQRPEYETSIANVSTQFGQQQPSEQGLKAKETVGQIPSYTRQPYKGTIQGSINKSVAPTGTDQGSQTENEPLSRLPIPGIRANTKYQATSAPQRATTPKYSPTNAPSQFDTQAPFDFEPSEGTTPGDETAYQPSDSRTNYPAFNKKVIDVNIPTNPIEDRKEVDRADDYEKQTYRPNQKISKPKSSERYPQDKFSSERNYYSQGIPTTVQPSTFAPKEQSYYSKSKPTAPSRIVTEPKSERPVQYSEETVSSQRDYNRQEYPTTRPTNFAPYDQTYYSKQKTVAPSRGVTEYKTERPSQYSEKYPQENESDENSYYRQGTSTARPSTFAPKDQTYYSKQKTVAPSRVTKSESEVPTQLSEQYPQGNVSDENNFYRQGTSTIRPNTFAPEEQNYYKENNLTPSGRPDVSLVKSGRPTFGKPTYSASSSRPVQLEQDRDFYNQYSTTSPENEAQDDKTNRPYSSVRPSIDEPKAAVKSQYTTTSPFNDVTDSDFEEGLANGNEKYGPTLPTDAQDFKPLAPTVPAFRNKGVSVPEYNRPERPQAEGDKNAVIINYKNEITPEGNFAYSFDTSNGIHADESGTAADGVKALGEFSYTGDDGKFYSVIYSADENGFQPRGDHLPTPPPIPEAILRVIEQAQREKEAGISNDGSYDDTKYGYKKYNGPAVGQPKLFDKTQEAFVTKNRRPINRPTQGQIEPITDKEEDTDDNKDYLDVEKIEDEVNPEVTSNQDDSDQYTSQYSTRRPINKTVKPNLRPGTPLKQKQLDSNIPEGKYYGSRRPTVEVGDADGETVKDITASDDQEEYQNVSQKDNSRPGRIQNNYDSSRRGPINVIGQDVVSDGFGNSDNDEERVPSIENGIKIAPTKSLVKSTRFPEQNRRLNVDTTTYDNSTEDELINEAPGSSITKKTRVESPPSGPQRNQDRLITQKYKPGSRLSDSDVDSERTPVEQPQERYSDTNRKEQRYPSQKFNKPTIVKVDDYGRKIDSGVTNEDTTRFDEESNNGDFDSIKPTTYETQQKIAAQNRYYQKPTGSQESGYDYIPPRNKFIQEPSRTSTKYATDDGKKIVTSNVPTVISSVEEDAEIPEQTKNVSEDRIFNKPVNPVTGKPRTKTQRPTANSPIDSEYEYQKQYNKLFGQEPEQFASVTSTRKPFFAPESRVTYKPNVGNGFSDDIDVDEKEITRGGYTIKEEEKLEKPTKTFDQRPPSRTYSKTSRPGFNQELRPNGEETEITGGNYNGKDEESQERPTQSFERPTSDQRLPSRTYSKTRPGSNQVTPNEYKVPSTTYRPIFSVSVTENKFDDGNYPTESSKAFNNENKRLPSNLLLQKNAKIRPVDSTRVPESDGSRFVTETKTVGEDFSGPQRPQYYDAETGYHY